MTAAVLLAPGDERRLEAFLAGHAESSMFLRSNLRSGGLSDAGGAYQGVYAAACEGDAIVGVAAHYRNGMVVLQAPRDADRLASAAVAASGRRVQGVIGPPDQASLALAALGLGAGKDVASSSQLLFSLDLSRLAVPAPLAEGRWLARGSRETDLGWLIDARVRYEVEALGMTPSPPVAEVAGKIMRRAHADGAITVLEVDGVPQAMALVNAEVADLVQVGGVWTPPAARGRGHGRAAVAGLLRSARASGARRAVLFTDRDNVAALRAYAALGFRRIGDYAMVLFERE